MEIDSKDAKFNETFSQYRERKGKLKNGNHIESDLNAEDEQNDYDSTTDDDNEDEKELQTDPELETAKEN